MYYEGSQHAFFFFFFASLLAVCIVGIW